MKRFPACAFLFFLTVLFLSCSKSTCQDPGIHATFSGFDTSELKQVTVLQYTASSNYGTLASVSLLDTTDTITQILQQGDTLIYPAGSLSQGVDIAPGFDYKISLPLAHRSYLISGISFHAASRHYSDNGNSGCTNDVSYYLDSIPDSYTGVVFNNVYPPKVEIVLNK